MALDLILIDDDELVHLGWKFAAAEDHKTILCFSSPKDFFLQKDAFDSKTVIYIDSYLASGVRGEDFAKELFRLGFENLYLTTGADPSSFGPMPWVRGIVGKGAPWRKETG